MLQPTAPLSFKFRFVKDKAVSGLLARKGVATDDGLDLAGEPLAYTDIVETARRDNRIVLAVAPGAGLGLACGKALQANRLLVLEVYKINAGDLQRHIERIRSAAAVAQHRRQLIAEGKGQAFRAVVCPQCQATVDLSGATSTRYTYCRSCESVFDASGQVCSNGGDYRTCDECEMFDRVRGYTVFYFYFLLVVYGYSYSRRHVCDMCAARLARRALAINLLFVLGVPSAIYMWIKASRGREPQFAGLATANRLALKGRHQEADAIYDRLLMNTPDHPGILRNQAIGHFKGQDAAAGVDLLVRSVQACGNYLPSLRLLVQIQEATAASQGAQATAASV